MKRFISLILAAAMVLAMVPTFTAFAAVEPALIEYNISTTALTEAASSGTYSNNTIGNVSWLPKGSATEATLDVPAKTAAYQLSCRLGSSVDNSPTLCSGAFFSQFVVNQWKNTTGYPTGSGEGDEQTKDNYSTGAIQYGIRIKVDAPGNYKLSLANNLSISDMISSYSSAKSFADSPLTPTKLEYGAVTKVYFAKATDSATGTVEATAASRKNENAALENEAYESEYLGLYDSRITGEQAYDMTLSIPKAGEYYIIFKADDDCLNDDFGGNSNVYGATTTSKTDGVVTAYYKNEFQLFVLSNITLTPVLPPRTHEYVIAREALTDGNNTTDYADSGTYLYQNVSWIPKGTNSAALLDLNKTDAYELSARIGSMKDNSSRLGVGAYYSQFLVNNWVVTANEKYTTDADAWAAARQTISTNPNYINGNIQYGIRLKVERPGTYTLSLKSLPLSDIRKNYPASTSFSTASEFTAGAVTKVYFAKAAADTTSAANNRTQETAALNNSEYSSKYIGLYDSRIEETQAYGDTEITIPEAGEYYVIFKANTDCSDASKGGNSSMYEKLSLSTTTENDVTTYNYTAQEFQLFVLSNITLTPVETEEETAMKAAIAEEVTETGLPTTATVNVYTRDIDEDTSVQTATKYTKTVGEEFTASAEEVIKDNYEFMYWEKGLGTERRVVSDTSEYTLKAVSGATHLTAVYKNKSSTTVPVIFFNGNGDELSKSKLDEVDAITAPEAYPSVPGGAQFLGWRLAGDDTLYTSEAVNELTASGNRMIFVAQFEGDEKKKDITITVNGEALAEKKYYGEEVTVTATAGADPDNKYFAYWEKGDEVVSFEPSYTFRAWEDCSLTAVCSSSVPSVTDALRKIIISGNVAEFIGLDDAVEKGILFNNTENAAIVSLANATHKLAMTTTGNHLSFVNDLEGSDQANYTGYAILQGGKVIYDK